MSDYIGLVLNDTQTEGFLRALLLAIAWHTEWHDGEPPTRADLPALVNQRPYQCNKQIDGASLRGFVVIDCVLPDHEWHDGDKVSLNFDAFKGGAS